MRIKPVKVSLFKRKQISTIVYNRGEVVSEKRAKKTRGSNVIARFNSKFLLVKYVLGKIIVKRTFKYISSTQSAKKRLEILKFEVFGDKASPARVNLSFSAFI